MGYGLTESEKLLVKSVNSANLKIGDRFLREDLQDLGWTKAELCRRLGLSKDAPRRWKAGPPKYVREYLRVCLLLKQGLEG